MLEKDEEEETNKITRIKIWREKNICYEEDGERIKDRKLNLT